MDIKLKFKWSEKARRAHALATGETAPDAGTTIVNTTDMTPDERVLFADERGVYPTEMFLYAAWEDHGWGPNIDGNVAVIDVEPTLADVVAIQRAALDSKAIAAAVRDARVAEENRQAEERRAAEAERRRIADEIEARNKAAAEEKAIRDRAEMEAWIAANGSERLRKAVAGGYRVDRLYAEERAAIEYPGFAYDGNDAAQWKERVGPSLEALNLAEATAAAHPDATEIKIVWLTTPVDPDEDNYDYEATEAVVVDDPHYKRWLVREM